MRSWNGMNHTEGVGLDFGVTVGLCRSTFERQMADASDTRIAEACKEVSKHT